MDLEVSEKNRDTYNYFEQLNDKGKKCSFIDYLILPPLITCVFAVNHTSYFIIMCSAEHCLLTCLLFFFLSTGIPY